MYCRQRFLVFGFYSSLDKVECPVFAFPVIRSRWVQDGPLDISTPSTLHLLQPPGPDHLENTLY